MAHIPDGVLSAPVLIGGAAVAVAGVALGLRHLDDRMILRAGLLSAVFFVGSLFAVPVGPSSVHLLLSGLMGAMLGLAAFPAVLIALFLQAILFGFSGLTSLGVNTVNVALPGIVLGMALAPLIRSGAPGQAALAAAVCAALAVFGTGALVAGALWLSSPDFVPVAQVMLVAYLPLALAEAAVTAAIVGFLARVQPDVLQRGLA